MSLEGSKLGTYSQKLIQDVGIVLAVCLQDTVQVLPQDPIEFIACWLYRYLGNTLYLEGKRKFEKDFENAVKSKKDQGKEFKMRTKDLNAKKHKLIIRKKKIMANKLPIIESLLIHELSEDSSETAIPGKTMYGFAIETSWLSKDKSLMNGIREQSRESSEYIRSVETSLSDLSEPSEESVISEKSSERESSERESSGRESPCSSASGVISLTSTGPIQTISSINLSDGSRASSTSDKRSEEFSTTTVGGSVGNQAPRFETRDITGREINNDKDRDKKSTGLRYHTITNSKWGVVSRSLDRKISLQSLQSAFDLKGSSVYHNVETESSQSKVISREDVVPTESDKEQDIVPRYDAIGQFKWSSLYLGNTSAESSDTKSVESSDDEGSIKRRGPEEQQKGYRFELNDSPAEQASDQSDVGDLEYDIKMVPPQGYKRQTHRPPEEKRDAHGLAGTDDKSGRNKGKDKSSRTRISRQRSTHGALANKMVSDSETAQLMSEDLTPDKPQVPKKKSTSKKAITKKKKKIETNEQSESDLEIGVSNTRSTRGALANKMVSDSETDQLMSEDLTPDKRQMPIKKSTSKKAITKKKKKIETNEQSDSALEIGLETNEQSESALEIGVSNTNESVDGNEQVDTSGIKENEDKDKGYYPHELKGKKNKDQDMGEDPHNLRKGKNVKDEEMGDDPHIIRTGKKAKAKKSYSTHKKFKIGDETETDEEENPIEKMAERKSISKSSLEIEYGTKDSEVIELREAGADAEDRPGRIGNLKSEYKAESRPGRIGNLKSEYKAESRPGRIGSLKSEYEAESRPGRIGNLKSEYKAESRPGRIGSLKSEYKAESRPGRIGSLKSEYKAESRPGRIRSLKSEYEAESRPGRIGSMKSEYEAESRPGRIGRLKSEYEAESRPGRIGSLKSEYEAESRPGRIGRLKSEYEAESRPGRIGSLKSKYEAESRPGRIGSLKSKVPEKSSGSDKFGEMLSKESHRESVKQSSSVTKRLGSSGKRIVRTSKSKPLRKSDSIASRPARWYWLKDEGVIVCDHPILGIMRSRQRPLYRTDRILDTTDLRCEALYDPDLYVVCDPQDDDEEYADRIKVWTGETWANLGPPASNGDKADET